jgi:hypothetical protein
MLSTSIVVIFGRNFPKCLKQDILIRLLLYDISNKVERILWDLIMIILWVILIEY